ncbi:Sulfotransferase family protein [Azotobacter beijerinckii]|uniref:Sulfotransferase family protein n=1 Tax=Azotobacter beijerinckii TaxID=170623 RepID=A0A1H6T5S5_9GAMM|nr:sulfotransferase family 2 domain-containing protein [Azotobacter beijerinckii]SEI72467.1 Sulfotransferase family protein [Azotobacter beijerinckii]
MDFLRRFFWRSMGRRQQDYLLGQLPVVEREAFKKTLFKKVLEVPQPFEQHQCLFIHVPKCAGKSLCASLFGDWEPGHLPLRWYAQLFPEFYARAFKFAIVRDPLDRAYSAYRYLLGNRQLRQDQAARRMLERYGSFDSFVEAWLCPENLQRQIHFAPQWQFLADDLGRLGVDFVGRYENLAGDFARICDRLKIKVDLAHINRSPGGIAEARGTIARATRERIHEVYRRDYQLFGYIPRLD